MTYTITNYDGTPLVSVADQTFDTTSTSLTLVGRANLNYGMMFNQNLVNLLENFSRSTAPTSPLLGQLWFDKGNNVLKIKDSNGFEPLATQSYGSTNYVGAASAGAQPLTITGDATGTMGRNTTPFNLVLDVNFPVTSVNGTVGAANVSYSNITGYAPDLYPSQDGKLAVASTLTVGGTTTDTSVGEIDFGSGASATKIVAGTSSLSFTANGSGAMVLNNGGTLTVAGSVIAQAGTFFLLDTNSYITRTGNSFNFTVAGGPTMAYASSGDLSLPGRINVGSSSAYLSATNGLLTLATTNGPAMSFNTTGVLTVPCGIQVQSTIQQGSATAPSITTAGGIIVQSGGMTVTGDVHVLGGGTFDGALSAGSGVLKLTGYTPSNGQPFGQINLGPDGFASTIGFYGNDGQGHNYLSFSAGGPSQNPTGKPGNNLLLNYDGSLTVNGNESVVAGSLFLGTGSFGEIIWGSSDTGSNQVLSLNGGVLYLRNGAGASNAGPIQYTPGSDKKLKKNVTAFKDGLSVVNALEVVNFEYRKESGHEDGKKHVGFIAQQVEPLVPRTIINVNDTLHLNKVEMIPHLVRAVQQLSAQNEALMARLEKLEGKSPD